MDTTIQLRNSGILPAEKYNEYAQAIRTCPDYTPEDRSILNRALETAREKGWNMLQLGKACNMDGSTANRLMLGTYPTNPARMIARMDNALRIVESRSQGTEKPEFVYTIQAQRIFETADEARTEQELYNITGASQIGKTYACKEYARTHDLTIYTYIPRPVRLSNMVRRLAKDVGVSPVGRLDDVTDAIRDKLTPDHLIIVDELQQLMLTKHRTMGLDILEYLRLEIFEQVGCGMLLVADTAWDSAFGEGMAKGTMERATKRGGKLKLPALPTNQDVETFCRHYGLATPPDKYEEDAIFDVASQYGMRVLSKLFRKASKIAYLRGEAISWNHFAEAYQNYVDLNGSK